MNKSFLQRNWYILTPALIVILPALLVCYFKVSYGYSLDDSLKAARYLGSTGTRYAQGFSELRFKQVRVGMDGKAVYNALRNPMERNMPEDTRWSYSLPASGKKYYHERAVILEKDAAGIPRVKQLVSRFHTPD